MDQQSEVSSFKLLLKQVYSAYSTRVKELENEIKILKEKLVEKERENDISECKRCIELEEAFKSCKKALHDQSKLFENFGQKFSIFNSPGLENQDLKSVAQSTSCSPEKDKNPSNFKSDASTSEKNEFSIFSLEDGTITDSKINDIEKMSALTNNQNILKKVMHHDENLESLDLYTVTFPPHFKQLHATAKFDSLILAPDSLDTTPVTKKNFERNPNDELLRESKNKKSFNFKASKKSIDIESKGSGKRLSSDSLNDDRAKRCNMSKQVENSSVPTKTTDVKTCNIVPPQITVTNEECDIIKQVDVKCTISTKNLSRENLPKKNNIKATSMIPPKIVAIEGVPGNFKKEVDLSGQNIHLSKEEKKSVKAIEIKENKNDTLKPPNFLNSVKKNKFSPHEASPSLLPVNGNAPQKVIDLENALNDDNDDFQEQVPSLKFIQNEDSWDACNKRKPVKKNQNMKCVKTTSKYKMTLDAPPLNYKKATYKQTKLSKSLFQVKDNNSNKKSPEAISHLKNNNCIIIEKDSSTSLQDNFQTSTPYDGVNSHCNIDIDATFIPDNFRLGSSDCTITNRKKIAAEKSHLKVDNLFSNNCSSEALQFSTKNGGTNEKNNEIEDHVSLEDSDLKENMNSFDRLPLPEEPAYKYKNDVVKKKSERRQLNGFGCKECERYYSELGLSDKEKKERMKKCSRHRGKYTPPSTPDHFWELEFPDTQECKARGYMNETQKVKLSNIGNI